MENTNLWFYTLIVVPDSLFYTAGNFGKEINKNQLKPN